MSTPLSGVRPSRLVEVVLGTARRTGVPGRPRRRLLSPRLRRLQDRLTAYGLMLPATAVFVVFFYLPAAYLFYLAFCHWGILSSATHFVGLRNFRILFAQPLFIRSLVTSAYYTLVMIPATVFLALGIALLLKEGLARRGGAIWRGAVFLFHVTPVAAGKIAMIDGTSAGYQKTLEAVAGKFPVGAFVEPAGSTGHAYNLVQGLGFVLPKGHTHAEDEAAWTFVQWWFGASRQVYWAEHTGYPPETRAGVAAMPSSFLATHPGEVATITATESPYSYPRPVSDSYNEVQAVIDSVFLDVVEGKQSVAAGLSSLDQQGNSYMSGASAL